MGPDLLCSELEVGINLSRTTPPNEYNSGVRFERLPSCPLEPPEIDKRFFGLNGEPTKELVKRFRDIRRSAVKVLKDPNASFFVVGGVVAPFDKEEEKYGGDLDIYVCTSSVNEEKQAPVLGNTAWKIAKNARTNRKIDLEVIGTAKSGRYTDVILSCGLPYQFWAFTSGEIKYVYDLGKEEWLICQAM